MLLHFLLCVSLKLLMNDQRHGIDTTVCDNDGMTPSMWACRMDNIEHFELLSSVQVSVEEEDGIERDNNGRTWMHWSVRRTEPLECLKVCAKLNSLFTVRLHCWISDFINVSIILYCICTNIYEL